MEPQLFGHDFTYTENKFHLEFWFTSIAVLDFEQETWKHNIFICFIIPVQNKSECATLNYSRKFGCFGFSKIVTSRITEMNYVGSEEHWFMILIFGTIFNRIRDHRRMNLLFLNNCWPVESPTCALIIVPVNGYHTWSREVEQFLS